MRAKTSWLVALVVVAACGDGKSESKAQPQPPADLTAVPASIVLTGCVDQDGEGALAPAGSDKSAAVDLPASAALATGPGSGMMRPGGGRYVMDRRARATARVTALEVSPSSLDAAVFRGHIRRYTGRLRWCYEAALKRDPGLRGTVEIELSVGADGGVGEVTTVSTIDDAMATCLKRHLGRLKFPASKLESVAKVSLSIVFAPPVGATAATAKPSRQEPVIAQAPALDVAPPQPDAAVMTEHLRGYLESLAACHEAARRAGLEGSIELDLDLIIDADGKVSETNLSQTFANLANGKLGANSKLGVCAVAAMKAVTFPRQPRGRRGMRCAFALAPGIERPGAK